MPRFTPTLIPSSVAALTVALALTISPATAAENPTLPLPELGAVEDIAFPGRTVEVPLSFRVPDGTVPATLTGQLQLPAEYSGGILEIHQDGRMYSATPLEVKGFTADVAAPLAGITVEDGQANLTLRVVLDVVGDRWCVEEPKATLLDAAVDFRGNTGTPTVVADFLPPVLKKLSIYVPADPTAVVQEATLEVATSLASVYRPTDLDVEVVELAPGATGPAAVPEDFERQIVLADNAAEGRTELVNAGRDDAFLRLAGAGETLYDQTRLLTDSMLPLAADVEVNPAGFGDIPDLSADVATLAELGNHNLAAESVARTRVTVGIERSRLRPYADSLDVHLTGTYTPLPDTNSGQITVSVGDAVLDAFTADRTGVIDRRFTVPGELMDRFVEVGVEFRSLGEVSCGTTQPVGLNIDVDSVVTSQHSDTPVLRGFRVLPQSFQPGVDVALTEGDVADLSRAVRVLTGIQSLSSQRIRPYLVDWDEAVAGARSTIFVDSRGTRLDQVPTYLNQTATTVEVLGVAGAAPVDNDLVRTLNTGSDLASASLQAVWDENAARMLLVASSSGETEQLDELIGWLDEDTARWAGLNGEILIRTGDREPVELSVVAAPEPVADSSRAGVAAAIAAVAVAAVLSLWAVRRPKQQKNKN
jgi:hypothetical protein